VRKTNSYFSLATVLLSLLILGLSFLVNLETLSHLWLPLSELPLLATQTLSYPPPLTATLVCYSTPLAVPPAANLYNSKGEKLAVRQLWEAEVWLRNPLLAKAIGKPLACLEFEGITYDSENIYYEMEVEATNTTLYI
jgi:hypothetical protein